MENINSTQHEEIKVILESINPTEFNIRDFIISVNKVKEKHRKPTNWSHDEWDNWYEAH